MIANGPGAINGLTPAGRISHSASSALALVLFTPPLSRIHPLARRPSSTSSYYEDLCAFDYPRTCRSAEHGAGDCDGPVLVLVLPERLCGRVHDVLQVRLALALAVWTGADILFAVAW